MNAAKKYQYGTEENKQFLKKNLADLLEFGRKFPSPGGGSYWLGDDGTPWPEKGRMTWITCRMAHVYSIGTILGVPGAEELAERAVAGLNGELHDDKNGGWYSGLTEQNEIMPEKQCYAHAFVLLAGSSAIAAGIPGGRELFDNAKDIIERYFYQQDTGLMADTWNTEFTVLDSYRGLNANMHTVEAFLAASDVTGETKYHDRAGQIIRRVIEWAENNQWRIPEHFHEDWTPDMECSKDNPADQFKPYGATPGHGMEWARLITQWTLAEFGTDAAENEQAKPYFEAAEKLFHRAYDDGWNVDGNPGIVYTTDWNGTTVIHDRMHWTLAEAVNTSAVLYRVTGKDSYKHAYEEFQQYLDVSVIDHNTGSWYHQMDHNNRPLDTVWPGKSDLYHAVQSCLIPYASPALSIVPAVMEEMKQQS